MNLVLLAAERPETLAAAVFVHGLASFSAEDGRELQAKHPDLVKRYGRLLADVSKPGLTAAEQTALQRKMWLEEYFPTLVADEARAAGLVAGVFRDAELSWPHAAFANAEGATFDARDRLAGIRVSSLVVAGARDLLPPVRVKPLADGIPGAKFVVFEKSGHFAPVEEPEAFRAAVYGFLGVAD
jgi:pimeloyl-ACP methyl ester carboxylesterase